MKLKNKVLSKLILLAVVVIGLVYIYTHQSDFASLLVIPIWLMVVIAIFQLATIMMNALFLIYITEPLANRKIPLIESLYITYFSTVGNLLTPFRGGMGLKAIYLKKNLKLPYSKFISTVYGNYLIIFFVSGLAGLLSSMYFLDISFLPALFFLSVSAATFIMMTFGHQIKIKDINSEKYDSLFLLLRRFANIINPIVIGWRSIRVEKNLITKLFIITLVNYFVSLVIYYLEFYAIGVRVGILSLLYFTSVSSLSLLLSITPGSLGVRELLLVFSSTFLGISEVDIIKNAVVDRGIYFVLLLLIFPFVQGAKRWLLK